MSHLLDLPGAEDAEGAASSSNVHENVLNEVGRGRLVNVDL